MPPLAQPLSDLSSAVVWLGCTGCACLSLRRGRGRRERRATDGTLSRTLAGGGPTLPNCLLGMRIRQIQTGGLVALATC